MMRETKNSEKNKTKVQIEHNIKTDRAEGGRERRKRGWQRGQLL